MVSSKIDEGLKDRRLCTTEELYYCFVIKLVNVDILKMLTTSGFSHRPVLFFNILC